MKTITMIETPDETTHDRQVWNRNLNTSYSVADFINPTAYDSHDDKQRAYVVLNAGYVLAIVFAEYPAYCDQDALDESADSGKLDGLRITEDELKDYEVTPGRQDWTTGEYIWPEYEGVINLGNAGEPFADESLDMWVLSARTAFGDDPALMTIDRVRYWLDEWKSRWEYAYDRTDVNADEWSMRYQGTRDIADALTLLHFAEVR